MVLVLCLKLVCHSTDIFTIVVIIVPPYINSSLIHLFSDRTLKVWSLDGLSQDAEQPISLKAKAVVAAHDKDINSLAVAPNDSLVCSGSQVKYCFHLTCNFFPVV